MPPAATAAQRLAELLLGETLSEWVGPRRARGDSWRVIADDLYETTDGQVAVTRETLRVWHRPPVAEPQTAGPQA